MKQYPKTTVTFDSIIVNSHGFENCRKAPVDLSLLEASIRSEGLREDLVIWEPEEDVHVLIAGHSRYRVLENIGKTDPDIFEDSFKDLRVSVFHGSLSDAMRCSLSENIHRNKLNPADEAEYIYLLKEQLEMEEEILAHEEERDFNSITQAQVAESVYGSSSLQGEISKKVRLFTNLCDRAFLALRNEQITQKTAEILIRKEFQNEDGTPNADLQMEYLEKLLSDEEENVLINKKPREKTYRTKREFELLMVKAAEDENIEPNSPSWSLMSFDNWRTCKISDDDLLYGTSDDILDAEEEVIEEDGPIIKRRIRNTTQVAVS